LAETLLLVDRAVKFFGPKYPPLERLEEQGLAGL